MARCQWCTAPLPTNSTRCRYCGKRSDVDLKGVHEFTVAMPASERICPVCEIPMQTIDLGLDGTFHIERCGVCLSLFFDQNEIEHLLEKSASEAFHVDRTRLNDIVQEGVETNKVIRYYRCPVCRTVMNRVSFGARSGVIVDQCAEHGMWLESGELRRLLEWRKAGGRIHDNRRRERREQERKQEEKRRTRDAFAGADPEAFFDRPDEGPFAAFPDPTESVRTFVRGVLRLFR